MKRRFAIAAILIATAAGALSGAAVARECGWRCAEWAQFRDRDGARDGDGVRDNNRESFDERRVRPPNLRGPGSDSYGGPTGDRLRSIPPTTVPGREPLSDGQVWAIAKSRVPGRIINARLQGPVYSFRIISNRGSIVDIVVDRYSGRIVSVRGGP
jgi:hypothetical protein